MDRVKHAIGMTLLVLLIVSGAQAEEPRALPAGDAARGQGLYQACSGCHSIDENDVADGQAGQHETGSRTPKNGKADHTRFLFCRLSRGDGDFRQPKPLKARLIHEPLFSLGSPPADFTSLYASLYQMLSGKL